MRSRCRDSDRLYIARKLNCSWKGCNLTCAQPMNRRGNPCELFGSRATSAHAFDIDVVLIFSSRVLGMKAQNSDNYNPLHTGEPMRGRPGISPAGGDVARPAAHTGSRKTTADIRRWNLSLSIISSFRPGAAGVGSGLADFKSRYQAFGLGLPRKRGCRGFSLCSDVPKQVMFVAGRFATRSRSRPRFLKVRV